MTTKKRQKKDYKNCLEIVFNMRKLGFFGGAFNPPTFAHIKLADYTYKKCKLDQLIFVPVGNKYQKEDLIDEYHRFNMLKFATKPYKNLTVSDIELGKNKSYTTIEAFELIAKQYPNDQLYFIMGADNLSKLPNWNRAEELVSKYNFIILERNTKESTFDIIKNNVLLNQYKDHFQIISSLEYKDISSKEVRDKLKLKQDVSEFISNDVVDYI